MMAVQGLPSDEDALGRGDGGEGGDALDAQESITASFLEEDDSEESHGVPDHSSSISSSPQSWSFGHLSTSADETNSTSSWTGSDDDDNKTSLPSPIPTSFSTTSLKEALAALDNQPSTPSRGASLPVQAQPGDELYSSGVRGKLLHSLSEPPLLTTSRLLAPAHSGLDSEVDSERTPVAGSFNFPQPQQQLWNEAQDPVASTSSAPQLFAHSTMSIGAVHPSRRPSVSHRKTHSGSISSAVGIQKRTSVVRHGKTPSFSASGTITPEDLEGLEEHGMRVHDFRDESSLLPSLHALDLERRSGENTPLAGGLARAPSLTRRSPILSHPVSLSRSNSGSLSRTNSGTRKLGHIRRTSAASSALKPPLTLNTAVGLSGAATPPTKRTAMALDEKDLLERLERDERKDTTALPLLVVDVRSLTAFLSESGRIKSSVNVNFPSLLIKRFRKGNTANFTLSAFITTEPGKSIYQSVTQGAQKPGTLDGVDVVVVDSRTETRDPTSISPGSVLISVLERMDDKGTVFYLAQSLSTLLSEERWRKWVMEGENDDWAASASETEGGDDSKSTVLLTLQPSATMKNLPQIASSTPVTASPPRAALQSPSLTPLNVTPKTPGRSKPPKLRRIDTSDNLMGRAANGNPKPRSRSRSPPRGLGAEGGWNGATLGARKSPGPMSIQSLCHVQSKSPSATATRFREADLEPPPSTARPHFPPDSPDTPTSSTEPTRFDPSTIIDGFLFLGPEPTKEEDLRELEALGVKQILNLALECEDNMGLSTRFEKYFKIPMRDFVEETGVQKSIETACRILGAAQLQSKPIYCHCRAGKSRSVTIVLAYLVHCNHWSLKRAYAHLSERRKGISPNIGFVSELMRWEERERGSKSQGVFGASTPSFSPAPHVYAASASASYFSLPAAEPASDNDEGGSHTRHEGRPRDKVRDSMPTLVMEEAMKSMMGGQTIGAEGGREIEVRALDGRWVPARRDPRDKDSKAVRRASKAGLESTVSSTTSWD